MTINPSATPRVRSSDVRRRFAVFLCLLCSVFAPSAYGAAPSPVAAVKATASKKTFDIPVGDAFTTLKRFFAQSGVQLIYKADYIDGVKTNAVKGEFTPREALECMLLRTELAVRQDEKTGALAIMPVGLKNDRDGSAGPPSDTQASKKKLKT